MTSVDTRSGRIEGIAKDGVTAFLGLPYARAERFRAPEPETPWTGVRRVDAFAPCAPQRGGMLARLGGLDPSVSSEDCQRLNVWTPAPDAGRRPVLVWIHGGSFTSGSGGSPLFDGTALARRGVVVVTISYRLGALGYLAHPGLPGVSGAAGNRGLLDQIAALEWVREHIGFFGGDPGRVLLFGESAGAMSIGTLLATPRAHGLFAAAALQSGAAENTSSAEDAARVGHHFLQELGANAATAERALSEASVEDLLGAQDRTTAALWRELSGLTYQPRVDGDVVPEPPSEAIAAGRGAAVPVVVGTNRDEYRLFLPTDGKAGSLDRAALVKRLRMHLPEPWPERAASIYVDERGLSPRDAWFAIETDRLFRAPALALAEAHADHAEAFVYRFDWASPVLDGLLGSCHGLEIPFVFANHRDAGVAEFAGSGEEADALAEAMAESWIAFAGSGAPVGEAQPPWPAHDTTKRSTRIFGAEGAAAGAASAPDDEPRAFWVEARRELGLPG
ncbi:MAG: carboxylesterase family protein [Myxococcota bacterium]|nr:carboxylesterase family protein [Myxococcota bacterium]